LIRQIAALSQINRSADHRTTRFVDSFVSFVFMFPRCHFVVRFLPFDPGDIEHFLEFIGRKNNDGRSLCAHHLKITI